ncbi:succinate--CoA ligase subunit beta [Mycobacterium sherrisii]|uniref:Succinate--CoA ligase n=1 Tax=Mycobacterium sherrisii TaxID=243061 RepID=A0A1E3T0V6_9MYCO|nr:ATP-grasp domain-containing protein [Mycobacterium sherrisii]MCV7028288.1 acetate--CoA ligase family protein [Mycobacterium sherrisii]MEC4764332.1 ATP-grasp domain-containing protein [Mycobacterium sherrisii]ODR07980.1 succinate--CoA ligase [Mycobacterium sherrisii]ORW77881.1 succinate--CoA ligase [Mycobacterium sherrisii]
MKLLEYQGKRLLADAGVRIPEGRVVDSPEEATRAAAVLGGRVVLKAQVPAGKRGKSGGVLFADSPEQAAAAARELLGAEMGGYRVQQVLLEQCVDIEQELYAAILNDARTKGPLLLFSTAGGMDIEEINAESPHRVHRLPVDILWGLDEDLAGDMLAGTDLPEKSRGAVAHALAALYQTYRAADADLVEVNPLAVTAAGELVALDSKVSLDPGALSRHSSFVAELRTDQLEVGTDLERRGRELGLQFIELDGDIGILANGAGLTMTSLDVVNHYGGKPANFLEIGGDAYTKATPALKLVLDNPRVRSLLINFCGAFARTDVMAEGVVAAIEELRPDIPYFFTIHGTGEQEAIRLVQERLSVTPYELMDDAVQAAVAAAATTVEV